MPGITNIRFKDKVTEAEKAADRGDSKTLHRIAKEISRKITQTIPINNADGKP